MSALALIQQAQPTVYVSNLDTTTSKPQLKEALFYRFARYGTVVDVVVMKRQKRLRGQAWVVFLAVDAAAKCIQDAQGKLLLGRKMKLAFARKKSNATAERDGTWLPVHARPEKTGADGRPEINTNTSSSNNNTKETSKLLVRDLPPQATVEAITALFGQFAQFLSATLQADSEGDDEEESCRNMLVEFGTSSAANVAYRNLNGFRLTPTDVLEMEFL